MSGFATEAAATGDETSAATPAPRGYEVLDELGRGGMGVVYRARQVQADRIVALKMIRGAELANDAERARFQTEAQSVARLSHPNIVPVYEVGEVRDLPFFSLEYRPGGSLAQKLARYAAAPARSGAAD